MDVYKRALCEHYTSDFPVVDNLPEGRQMHPLVPPQFTHL